MADDGVVRRPAVPQPVRIRRDVNRLATDDPAIVWYRRAIRAMKARPLNDPRSWRYQAAIHDYPENVSSTASRRNDVNNPDPFANDADVIPSDHRTYWRQCQHNSWFFIPWHRMYLHFFEKIVASHVVDLGGPKDWALPYWNYSPSADTTRLPEAFRQPQNASNDLYVQQREPRANRGEIFLDLRGDGTFDPTRPETSLNQCLRARPFGANGPSFGFGGPQIANHPSRGNPGSLESVPHNTVHGALGGPGPGFMSLFSTAPLDPMFWLHHCNIDRLWEVWVQRQKQQGNLDRNPKVPSWLTALTPPPPPFGFHDAQGNAVQMKVSEVLDTRAAPLSYEFEDTRDPFNGAP